MVVPPKLNTREREDEGRNTHYWEKSPIYFYVTGIERGSFSLLECERSTKFNILLFSRKRLLVHRGL